MMVSLLENIGNARIFNYLYNRYTNDLITEENRQKYNRPYDVFLGWLENTPENDLARIGRGWKSIDEIGKEMANSIKYVITYAEEKEGDENND